VADAFTRGEVRVKDDGFEIHASRRDAPGRGEVHETDTDVIHVLSGTATFVTGGSLVDPEAIAPGEIRGTSIRGGQERVLREGDVIVVPAGVPHWFMTVDAPVTYHVVKVR
jgi:quercetin dioxygenase-like cupin family protein